MRGVLTGAAVAVALAAFLVAVLRGFLPFFVDAPFGWTVGIALPAAAVGGWLGRGGGRGSVVALATACVAWLVVVAWPTPRIAPKLVMLGVDGSTFDVIDPMVEAGELPAFGRLARQAVRMELTAREPLTSPVLWTTIASGRPPVEHGVFSFRTRSTDCRVPRFWDVAAASGLRVGLFKWLVTWPPPEVDGFVVPGWLAEDATTRPASLGWSKEIELSRRHRRRKVEGRSLLAIAVDGVRDGLTSSTMARIGWWQLTSLLRPPSDEVRFVREQRLRTRLDYDAFVAAVHGHRPDLATLTLYATDAVAHRAWYDDDAPDPELGSAVADTYRDADDVLGDLLRRLPASTTLVVLSDHGSGMVSSGGTRYFRLRTDTVEELLAERVGPADVARVGAKLTVVPRDPARRDAMVGVLEGLVDSRGVPFLRTEPVHDLPHGIGVTAQWLHMTEAGMAEHTVDGRPMSDFVVLEAHYRGEHTERGILYIRTPGVESGGRPAAQQVDVAPTLYALLGIAPPPGLPGRVLVGEPLPPEPYEWVTPTGSASPTRSAEVQEALRALGYVD